MLHGAKFWKLLSFSALGSILWYFLYWDFGSFNYFMALQNPGSQKVKFLLWPLMGFSFALCPCAGAKEDYYWKLVKNPFFCRLDVFSILFFLSMVFLLGPRFKQNWNWILDKHVFALHGNGNILKWPTKIVIKSDLKHNSCILKMFGIHHSFSNVLISMSTWTHFI